MFTSLDMEPPILNAHLTKQQHQASSHDICTDVALTTYQIATFLGVGSSV